MFQTASPKCHFCLVASGEAAALKPATFSGCTFDESTAAAASVTGVLMDGLCYDNFVVDQKNYNGAPGLAPDKVRGESLKTTNICKTVKQNQKARPVCSCKELEFYESTM